MAYHKPVEGTYRIFIGECFWGDSTNHYMGWDRDVYLVENFTSEQGAVEAAKYLRRYHPDSEGKLSVRLRGYGCWQTATWKEGDDGKVAPNPPPSHIRILYGGQSWTSRREDMAGIRSSDWEVDGNFWSLDRRKEGNRLSTIIDLVHKVRETHPNCPKMTIVDDSNYDNIVWAEQGGTTMEDALIKQPVNIPRENLLTMLQAKLDEEVAEREKKEDDLAVARQELTALIKTLSDDEITNIVLRTLGYDDAATATKKLQERIDAETYVSPEVVPTKEETSLAKLVRIYNQSDDTHVEVTATDSIYDLL